MTIIAHAGGLLTSLIYLAPVVIAIGSLVIMSRRDRRRGEPRAPIPTDDGEEP